MATQSKYKLEDGRELTVFYPEKAAPFIPQSCYAYGRRNGKELCRRINNASQCIFDALMLSGRGDERAAFVASDLVDTLVCDLGFDRTSTQPVY